MGKEIRKQEENLQVYYKEKKNGNFYAETSKKIMLLNWKYFLWILVLFVSLFYLLYI